MATKRGLAERILKKYYPRLTQDSKTTLQEMAIAVGTARDFIITTKLTQAYGLEDYSVYGGYIKDFGYEEDIKVSFDNMKQSFYIEMPAFPLNLPRHTGIREVGIRGNEGEDTFVPLQSSSNSLYKGLYGSHPNIPRVGYWFEGYRMYFSKPLSEKNCIYIKMIPASEYLDDRDEFYISPEDEDLIIQKSLEYFGVTRQIPEDQANNNVEQ